MKLSDIRQLTRHFSYTDSPDSQAQVRQIMRQLGYDPDAFYQELEMESPLVDTHRDTSFSNNQTHLHSHSFFELLYCRSSCGAEYLVGADRYRLQRGDIVFVPPGMSHRPLLPEGMAQPYKRYVVWLSPEFMSYFTSLAQPEKTRAASYGALLRTAGTQWEFLGEVFRKGVEEAERQSPGWQAFVVGNTITLLIHLYRALQDRSAAHLAAEKPELLDQVLAFVEENLSARITLPDTATRFYVSQSTISQLFRKKMGVSFYRCVTQRRLIAAKEQILSGIPLEQVAQQVGFADYSSFYRAFRQEYGISPRQFRALQDNTLRSPAGKGENR